MAARKILVFRTGQLGDTLVALPALRVVRASFPRAQVTLLCDRQVGRDCVVAREIVEGLDVVDACLAYPVDVRRGSRPIRWLRTVLLLFRIRLRRFDTLVYLAPTLRPPAQRARDRRFFRLCGIRRCLGMDGFAQLPRKVSGRPLPRVPREADMLLHRLVASGLRVDLPAAGLHELPSTKTEEDAVRKWLAVQPCPGRRIWIGIGPGSKMPAKLWPTERYVEVVARLIVRFDVWPVVFGSAADRATGDDMVRRWGRGFNAAGVLTVKEASAALRRCRLYLGNDTGTMHLAAAVATRCVAIFSARDHPGAWEPCGTGHRVLRHTVDCDGCMLEDCIERAKECLYAIRSEQVFDACVDVLEERAHEAAFAPDAAREARERVGMRHSWTTSSSN